MRDSSIIISSELDRTGARVILGIDEQFIQISRFCNLASHESTILGIDRTFDLSSMYATITVFKQLDLFRARTSDAPIMLGPILLSTDATEQTYTYFLNHLKWKLDDQTLQGVIFNESSFLLGSDQERALINAMENVFPEATRFVCVFHIQKNIRERLRKLSVEI